MKNRPRRWEVHDLAPGRAHTRTRERGEVSKKQKKKTTHTRTHPKAPQFATVIKSSGRLEQPWLPKTHVL